MKSSASHSDDESPADMASGIRALYRGVSPQSVLSELFAGEASNGSSLGRKEQVGQLEDWLGTRGLRVPKAAIEGRFVGSGAEHETYFDRSGGVAIKVTHDGRFGHCLREEGAISTPFDYLRRLAWHNELFGDDILLHGLLDCSAGLRLVSSQSWIVSHPHKLSPTQGEIDAFLEAFGFRRSALYPDGFIYYSADLDLVIGDAQPANLLMDEDGVIRPIDLVIAQPSLPFRQRLLAPSP